MSNRSGYMKEYAANHSEEAAERKQFERGRKDRLRSYWYGKLILNREMPALKSGCTEEQIEQARIEYMRVLEETE